MDFLCGEASMFKSREVRVLSVNKALQTFCGCYEGSINNTPIVNVCFSGAKTVVSCQVVYVHK